MTTGGGGGGGGKSSNCWSKTNDRAPPPPPQILKIFLSLYEKVLVNHHHRKIENHWKSVHAAAAAAVLVCITQPSIQRLLYCPLVTEFWQLFKMATNSDGQTETKSDVLQERKPSKEALSEVADGESKDGTDLDQLLESQWILFYIFVLIAYKDSVGVMVSPMRVFLCWIIIRNVIYIVNKKK